jgi:hypothetical protein
MNSHALKKWSLSKARQGREANQCARLLRRRARHARAENLDKVREEVALDELGVQLGDPVDLRRVRTERRASVVKWRQQGMSAFEDRPCGCR